MIGRSRRCRIGSDYPFFGARLPILRSGPGRWLVAGQRPAGLARG